MLQALFIFAFCLSSTQAFYCGPGSSDCEPNCDDGVSVCDLSYQNCLNDGFGGCFDVPTVTFIASLVPYPVTSYVASEYFTVTTGYPTQIVPLDSEIPEYVDATSYAYQTEVHGRDKLQSNAQLRILLMIALDNNANSHGRWSRSDRNRHRLGHR